VFRKSAVLMVAPEGVVFVVRPKFEVGAGVMGAEPTGAGASGDSPEGESDPPPATGGLGVVRETAGGVVASRVRLGGRNPPPWASKQLAIKNTTICPHTNRTAIAIS